MDITRKYTSASAAEAPSATTAPPERTQAQPAAAAATHAWRRSRLVLPALMLAGLLLSVALRAININGSFDIFVDEANYLSVAQGVRETLRPETFEGPFYLHGPAFFYLQAGYLELTEPVGNFVAQLYTARFLNVFLAGLSAVLLFAIAYRVAGIGGAAAATLIFATDPWLIRINSRNFLETSAMLWILIGYAVLIYNAPRRRHWPTVAGVGLAFGLALLTKELTIFTTLLPLAVCTLLGWAYRRRTLVLAGATAIALYAVYPLLVLINGQWGEFAWQKLSGVRRISGLTVTTGFSRPAGPSFLDAVQQNLGQFATTYAIILVGAIGVGVLLFQRRAELRILVAWAVCAYAAQAFSILGGTNEEHLFYYLVIPALLAATAGIAVLFGTLAGGARPSRWIARAGAAAMLVYLGWCGALWAVRHTTPDNGSELLLSYIEHNVPHDSRIAATTMTTQWVLREESWRSGRWGTSQAICTNRAEYAILSSLLSESGHDIATPELAAWLDEHGERVFVFDGPSTGRLSLYQIPAQACAAVSASGAQPGGTP